MDNKTANIISQVISVMLIFLFTYTAASKLENRSTFQIVLSTSPLISSFAKILSWSIPLIEAVIVILLFFPRFRTTGLLASAGLMGIFTCYIGYMLVFVSEKPCSCGGILAKMTWMEHLIFNICFTLLSYCAYYLSSHKRFIAINRTSRTPV